MKENWIKRIARRILNDELTRERAEFESRIELLEEDCKKSLELAKSYRKEFERLNSLRKHNYLISQEIFEGIVRCLPNAIDTYCGIIRLEEITNIIQTADQGETSIQVGAISTADNKVTGVVVDIKRNDNFLDTKISIPIVKEKVLVNNMEVELIDYDFTDVNFKVINNSVWNVMTNVYIRMIKGIEEKNSSI